MRSSFAYKARIPLSIPEGMQCTELYILCSFFVELANYCRENEAFFIAPTSSGYILQFVEGFIQLVETEDEADRTLAMNHCAIVGLFRWVVFSFVKNLLIDIQYIF